MRWCVEAAAVWAVQSMLPGWQLVLRGKPARPGGAGKQGGVYAADTCCMNDSIGSALDGDANGTAEMLHTCVEHRCRMHVSLW